MRELLKRRLRQVFEEILDELIGRLTNSIVANCIECGSPADHFHHPIPRVLGGTSTIPVCHACHGKIHGLDFQDHGTLVRAGIEGARDAPDHSRILSHEKIAQIRAALDRGIPERSVMKLFRCGNSTIQRIKRGKL